MITDRFFNCFSEKLLTVFNCFSSSEPIYRLGFKINFHLSVPVFSFGISTKFRFQIKQTSIPPEIIRKP